MHWKVKDLLDLKVDDAAIDVFPVPDDAYLGRKMAYVVATAAGGTSFDALCVLNALDVFKAAGSGAEV
jgi:hypothetical protein